LTTRSKSEALVRLLFHKREKERVTHLTQADKQWSPTVEGGDMRKAMRQPAGPESTRKGASPNLSTTCGQGFAAGRSGARASVGGMEKVVKGGFRSWGGPARRLNVGTRCYGNANHYFGKRKVGDKLAVSQNFGRIVSGRGRQFTQ